MEWYDIEVINGSTVNFVEKLPANLSPADASKLEHDLSTSSLGKANSDSVTGGIIKNGKWAWLAVKSTLHIISLANGYTVSKYIFNKRGHCRESYQVDRIRCVEEIFPESLECVLLAVCLESDSNADTEVALYSIYQSYVLRYIRFNLSVTCLAYIDSKLFRDSLMRNFDGCLAVGSEEGVVVILDLNLKRLLSEYQLKKRQRKAENLKAAAPHIVNYAEMMTETMVTFLKCQNEGQNFGLQMEVINAPCAVCSMLSIDFVTGLAVGYEDGRIALYDLFTFHITGILRTRCPRQEAPVQRMIYLVPSDDPRPCFYIFSLQAGNYGEPGLTAFLHVFMYEKRVLDADNVGMQYFENLKKCESLVHMALESKETIINGCQSISVNYGDDAAANSFCVISWHSLREQKNNIIFFDLDQWYKEQMPDVAQLSDNPSFLAGYTLSSRRSGLLIWINPNRLAPFKSMLRFDENFYPNSLSFECTHILTDSCHRYNWAGAQNLFLYKLRCRNATIFLEPESYHSEILRLHLMPQFCELKPNATWSKQAMYTLILSVCLEHQCYNLLHDCAKSWVDGSFLRNFAVPTNLSLSTLTNWIFWTANQIKTRCNDICKAIFKCGSNIIEQRVRKELDCITRQMRALAHLQAEIVSNGSAYASDNVLKQFSDQECAIRLAADYQEVMNWLFNIGLLPEMPAQHSSTLDIGAEVGGSLCVFYPFTQLREFYASKRKFFANISKEHISSKTGACRLLFIDALVTLYNNDEHNNKLSDFWADTHSLYPPASIEALLRIMLVPKLSFEEKCSVVFYFLLDLNTFLDESRYKHIIQNFIKFQNVFQLSPTLVKTMEAFWSLDHGKFEITVEKFLSPMNDTRTHPSWQLDLLIEALLIQGAEKLALCVLEIHSCAPLLHLKTLLANEMLVTAFNLARSLDHGKDQTLLTFVFTSCLNAYKFPFLRDLKLSQREDRLLQQIFRESKIDGAETLYFVYLLQKSKYLEAVSYMDEKMRANASGGGDGDGDGVPTDPLTSNYYPKLMLTAYKNTVTPVTKHLTDEYLRIRHKLRPKEFSNMVTEPFSAQLVKHNANKLLGGMYHSSALSAHFATLYWGEAVNQSSTSGDPNNRGEDILQSPSNVPFLRKPHDETNILDLDADLPISTPVPYVPVEKRRREFEPVAGNKTMDLGVVQCSEVPRKRRRILGEEIANELVAHFQNVSSTKLPATTPLTEVSGSSSVNINMLLQSLSGFKSPLKRSSDVAFRLPPPPPSILKTTMPQQHDEKTLSFHLPSVTITSPTTELFGPATTPSEPMECDDDDDDDEQDEIFVELKEQERSGERENIPDTPAVVVVHKDVAETVSAYSTPLGSISSEHGLHGSSIEEAADASLAEKEPTTTQHSSIAAVPSLSQTQFGGPKPRSSLSSVCVAPTMEVGEETEERLAVSSGFGSGECDSSVATRTATAIETATDADADASLMPLNTMQSSREFAPSVCSSKVCETQSKFVHAEQRTSVAASQSASYNVMRYAECTTVLGSLDSNMTMSLQRNTTSEMQLQPSVSTQRQQAQAQAYRHLDTTLGMSTYDLTTTLNTSESLQQSPTVVVLPSELEDNTTAAVSRDRGRDDVVEYEHIESSSSPDNEESVHNSASDLGEGEEEASIAPSIEFSGEESVSSGNDLEYDADIIMHMEPQSLARAPISSVTTLMYEANVDNDQMTNSSASLEFATGPTNEQMFTDGEREQQSALYRVNSVETLTELDTTKESNDGIDLDANDGDDDDDDECVVALDGTRVREFVPRAVQRPMFENRNQTVTANVSEEPEASVPAAEGSTNVLQRAVSGSSLDSVQIVSNAPTAGALSSPSGTSPTFLETSASVAAIDDSASSMEGELKPLPVLYSAASPVCLTSSSSSSSSNNSSLVVVATQDASHVGADSNSSDVILIDDTQDGATLQRQQKIDHMLVSAATAMAAAAATEVTAVATETITSEIKQPIPSIDNFSVKRSEDAAQAQERSLHADSEDTPMSLPLSLCTYGTENTISGARVIHVPMTLAEEEEEKEEEEGAADKPKPSEEMRDEKHFERWHTARDQANLTLRKLAPTFPTGTDMTVSTNVRVVYKLSVVPEEKEEDDKEEVKEEEQDNKMDIETGGEVRSVKSLPNAAILDDTPNSSAMPEMRMESRGRRSLRSTSVPPVMISEHAQNKTPSEQATITTTPRVLRASKSQQSLNKPRDDTPTLGTTAIRRSQRIALLATSEPATSPTTTTTPQRRSRQNLRSVDSEEHVAARKVPRLSRRSESTSIDSTVPELMERRNLRSRSVGLVGAESEHDTSTPKRATPYTRQRIMSSSRRNSDSEHTDTEEHVAPIADSLPVRRRTRRTSQLSAMSEDEKPSTSRTATPTMEYETARRLTRGQLASIEKSANLSKTQLADMEANGEKLQTAKDAKESRCADDDKASESGSSHVSSSSRRLGKRRSTRTATAVAAAAVAATDTGDESDNSD